MYNAYTRHRQNVQENGDIQKRLLGEKQCYQQDTRLWHIITSIVAKRSSHLLHLPKAGSYPRSPEPKPMNHNTSRHKKSLPPVQYICSCQPYRRQLRMSTLPQQQASVTLNRQEKTAPQDQTPAQAYRTPRDMHRLGTHTTLSQRNKITHAICLVFTICTHTHRLCVKRDIVPPYLH